MSTESYVYKYKKSFYRVLGHGKMKDPSTRKWVDAVFYVQVGQHEVYARGKAEFYERFTPLTMGALAPVLHCVHDDKKAEQLAALPPRSP